MTDRLLRVWWGSSEDQSVEDIDPEELELTLDRLASEARDRPLLVDIIDPAGDVLTIGLGRSETVLAFVSASGEPPYLVSRPDEPAYSYPVWFDYAGAESEFGSEQTISIEVGRSVVRSFALTGDLSAMEWAEV